MNRHRFLGTVVILALALALGLTGVLAGCGNGATTDDGTTTTVAASPAKVTGDGLVVLGLGAGPVYWTDRNNTGFALSVNGALYMIDCGAGTPNAFFNMGLGFEKLENLFITHLHIDHTVGYADLLARAYGTREPSSLKKLDVWGPAGLKSVSDGFMAGLAKGFQLHNWRNKPVPPWVTPTVHELDVAATGVTEVKDAFAYRFDIVSGANAGKSIVFSGDRANNNKKRDAATNEQFRADFKALAQGASILVHEVQKTEWASKIAEPSGGSLPLYEHLVNSHTDVNELPAIAKDLGVGKLVLCHYGAIDTTYPLSEAIAILTADITKANETVGFAGKIILPKEMDLITF
jgi:ribonuclease BN (tRNA processing enzyme)